MQAVIILLIILIAHLTKTNQKATDNFEKHFPYFRLKMEEVFGDEGHEAFAEPSDNFVSFLVDNVKKLFVPPDNSSVTTGYSHEMLDSALLLDSFRTSTDIIISKKELTNNFSTNTISKIERTNKSLIIDNFLLPFLRVESDIESFDAYNSIETSSELLKLLKNLESTTKKRGNYDLMKSRRTCIACNNILNEDCSNPQFKLIPSTNCQREDDVCYSQHTPFGIIDRGCFNVNHDLTIFVCACNLCNYISISEMPYIFSNKRDWVENVIELSRAKRFRESIFKDMSCLRCEVNVTAKRGNMFADASCLEGNIAVLPHQVCTADEICGIKAVRSNGYIWRGCIREPLYNYWWNLCNNDWCNYDAIVSVYDPLN